MFEEVAKLTASASARQQIQSSARALSKGAHLAVLKAMDQKAPDYTRKCSCAATAFALQALKGCWALNTNFGIASLVEDNMSTASTKHRTR